MSHDSISRRLGAYIDGEVPAEERIMIERHIAECPPCAASLKEWQTLSHTIRQLTGPAIDGQVMARLHAGIERMGRRPVERFVGLLSGIAACLAMMGGLMLLRPASAASLSAPARWEAHAVGMIDENLIATGGGSRDTAFGEWMISNLSVHGRDGSADGGPAHD